MRLHLSATQPDVFLTDNGLSPLRPCWSCHSLSANGAMLVAQHHQYPGGPYLSASFDLAANPLSRRRRRKLDPRSNGGMGLGAVYGGTKVLTTGNSGDSTSNVFLSFPDAPGNIPGMLGPRKLVC
jgi:hypothetical protein